MNVNININDCIGCGVCSQVCPEIFGVDDDLGKAWIQDVESVAAFKESISEAIDSCPIGCISE